MSAERAPAGRVRRVPARSRVGFVSYFSPDWHHDHVLAEWWDGERWVWSDPELDPAGDWPFDGYDIDPEAGHFESAARVWLAYRAGRIDPGTYGVDPSLPFRGDWFIHDYVLLELAHRHKDEVLLWDGFGAMTDDLAGADLTLVDEVAALLVAADRGDTAAGRELARRYASDARLRPGPTVHCMDPVSGTAADVGLRR